MKKIFLIFLFSCSTPEPTELLEYPNFSFTTQESIIKVEELLKTNNWCATIDDEVNVTYLKNGKESNVRLNYSINEENILNVQAIGDVLFEKENDNWKMYINDEMFNVIDCPL